MKRVSIVFIFIILFICKYTKAEITQTGSVHQYIVRQAWELAKYQRPDLESTDLARYIGNSETGNGPWRTGLVVMGAFREDKEDPVYLYGGTLGINWHVTMTHFWDADLGDDFKWNYAGIDWENHFQKAKAYLYSEHEIFINIWSDNANGIAGRLIKYESLFHFFNTGQCYVTGYIDLQGHPIHYESPLFTTINDSTAKAWAYEILGRLCHLIGDAGTPAHAHNDAHPPIIYENDDYEDYMSSHYSIYDYQDALNSGGVFFDIFEFNHPLRFLLYTTNQVADHFPSDDRPGDNTVIYSYEGDSYEELNEIINNLGASPSSVNPSDIAEAAFVYSIRSTATLLYWFAVETGQVPHLIPIVLSGIHTLTENLLIPPGNILIIKSGSRINLNG